MTIVMHGPERDVNGGSNFERATDGQSFFPTSNTIDFTFTLSDTSQYVCDNYFVRVYYKYDAGSYSAFYNSGWLSSYGDGTWCTDPDPLSDWSFDSSVSVYAEVFDQDGVTIEQSPEYTYHIPTQPSIQPSDNIINYAEGTFDHDTSSVNCNVSVDSYAYDISTVKYYLNGNHKYDITAQTSPYWYNTNTTQGITYTWHAELWSGDLKLAETNDVQYHIYEPPEFSMTSMDNNSVFNPNTTVDLLTTTISKYTIGTDYITVFDPHSPLLTFYDTGTKSYSYNCGSNYRFTFEYKLSAYIESVVNPDRAYKFATSTTTRTYYVDGAPDITTTSTDPVYSISVSKISIGASAWHVLGNCDLEFYCNGSKIKTVTDVNDGTRYADIINEGAGTYNWYVKATSRSGNGYTATSSTQSFIINSPPLVSNITPSNVVINQSDLTPITITADVDDQGDGDSIDTTIYKNGQSLYSQSITGAGTVSYDYVPLFDEDFDIYAYVNDGYDTDQSATESVSVRLTGDIKAAPSGTLQTKNGVIKTVPR